MTDPNISNASPRRLSVLARAVLVLLLGMIVIGILWHGISTGVLKRLWDNLLNRPDGTMSFRFILQPAMAIVVAVRDGRRDVRLGRNAYFATLVGDRAARGERLREGLNATARIILLGIIMDAVYQAIALHRFYPNEAVIVALVLAFLPYVAARGLVTRAVRQISKAAGQ